MIVSLGHLWLIGIIAFIPPIVYFSYVVRKYNFRLAIQGIIKALKSQLRILYVHPILSVAVVSTAIATCSYYIFNKKGTVFASILYASIFFFNASLRSHHPFPVVTEISDNSIDASEYEETDAKSGHVLLSKIKVENYGYGKISNASIYFHPYPAKRNGKEVDNMASDGLSWKESKETMSEKLSLEQRESKEIDIQVDEVADDIDSAKYFIIVEIRPQPKYSFLARSYYHTHRFGAK